MAQVTIPGGLWMPAPWQVGTAAPAHTGLTMDAAAEKYAMIFDVPRSGVLESFEFRTATVLNNPDNGIRISFQNLDASGDPDGTQDQFRDITGTINSNTWFAPGLITSDGTDGGVKRTVTAGDRLAVVIEFISFTASDSFQIAGLSMVSGSAELLDTQNYVDHFTAAWAKNTTVLPLGALKYVTDGFVPIHDQIYPVQTFNTRTYGNGSTPDEIALYFQVPFSGACDGFWVRSDVDADVDVVLYDSDGTSTLASYTIDSSARITTAGAIYQGHWAPVTLSANTNYRLSIKPTSASTFSLYTLTTNSAALMGGAPGGTAWHRSERTDAGAWSQTTTERPLAGLHFASVDVSAGGGGRTFAAYTG